MRFDSPGLFQSITPIPGCDPLGVILRVGIGLLPGRTLASAFKSEEAQTLSSSHQFSERLSLPFRCSLFPGYNDVTGSQWVNRVERRE